MDQQFDLQELSSAALKENLWVAIIFLTLMLFFASIPFWPPSFLLRLPSDVSKGNLADLSVVIGGLGVIVFFAVILLSAAISILKGGAKELKIGDGGVEITFPDGIKIFKSWSDPRFILSILEVTAPRPIGRYILSGGLATDRLRGSLLPREARDSLVDAARRQGLHVVVRKSVLDPRCWSYYGLDTMTYIHGVNQSHSSSTS